MEFKIEMARTEEGIYHSEKSVDEIELCRVPVLDQPPPWRILRSGYTAANELREVRSMAS